MSSESEVEGNRSQSLQVATNLFVSFQYAWTGITYAFKTQRNFRIHTVIGSLAISLSVILNITPIEIAIIGLTIGAVMAMELLNTAIESIVDLSVGQSFHELAKIAKDCAAGAVLIFSLAAVLVAGVLLLPPLLTVIMQWI
ncbi:MAG: diacylglycerol kinase family protein [Microcoleaceae cyanobacterium]